MATSRDPWQEPFANNLTVPASKSLEAAKVFQGFTGSWAAEYSVQPGIMDLFKAEAPAPVFRVSSHLGHPGYPEVNFAPYAQGTNRQGSLLGCPVSFSVVGPTLKRGGNCNWQWNVINHSATPAQGDTLTLEDLAPDFTSVPPATVAWGWDLADTYGLTSMADCPDGLYLIITHTGNPGQISHGGVVAGGVGDGDIWAFADGNTRRALVPKSQAAKYEIFRVIDITGARITLDPAKRLADFFTFGSSAPGNLNVVRGVMLFEPKASRLVAIPDSGDAKGQEKTFVVVPPARAAQDDQLYPYKDWHSVAFTEEGWFTSSNGQQDTYLDFEYRNAPQLPVAKPSGKQVYRLFGNLIDGAPWDPGPGRFILMQHQIDWGTDTPAVGEIIQIHNVRVVGSVHLGDSTSGPVARTSDLDCLIGSYEVVRIYVPMVGNPQYIVRRVPDTDPATGRTFIGNNYLVSLDQTIAPAAGHNILVDVTIHKPISSLWTTSYADTNALDSCRLTNLIDPSWAGDSIKGQGNSLLARSDRAVFNTETDGTNYANPGSLLDLGFRMVFFPAKTRSIDIPDPTTSGAIPWADPYQTVDVLVPDFDHPIMSNEVLLDPTKRNEKQYIEVDYANGLVRLSHAIKVGSPLYSADVFTNTSDNPRGEQVIFASFVPYSREEGQLGSGIQISVGQPTNEMDVPGIEQGTEQDSMSVYGVRKVIPLNSGTTNTLNNTRTNYLTSIVIDNSQETDIPLPSAGFVEVLSGYSADGLPCLYDIDYRGSLFGYYAVQEDVVTQTVTLYGRYGGGIPATSKVYDSTVPGVVVARKEVILPSDTTAQAGVPYQYDVTYGSAKRSSQVRFGDADTRVNSDGSVSVNPRDTIAKSIQEGLAISMGPALLLAGGRITGSATMTTVTFTSEDIAYLYQGEKHQHGSFSVSISKAAGPATKYIVFYRQNGAVGLDDVATLPVADDLILLAKVEIPATGSMAVATITDLRYPLQNFDGRTDVLVGGVAMSGYSPWFQTIATAVKYAGEMMAPTAGGSTPNKNMRIWVVGPTQETQTPIVMPADGLSIQGYGKIPSGTSGNIILWDGNGPLFDLNGKLCLTFRDLICMNALSTVAGVSTVTATGTGSLLSDTLDVYTQADTSDPYITIAVTVGGISLPAGGAGTITLTASTFNGVDGAYTWSSSNNLIATVVAGVVTAGANTGTVIISATGNTTGVVGKIRLTVHDGVTAAVVVGGMFVVRDGQTTTLRAESVNGAVDVTYNWISSYTDAITVATPGVSISATAHEEEPRCMFTNTAGSYVSGLNIDNCWAMTDVTYPHLHGFMYILDDPCLETASITSCYTNGTAFGIYCRSAADSLNHVIVRDNFWMKSSDNDFRFRLPHLGGGVVLEAGTISNLYVENNNISGYGNVTTTYPVQETGYDVVTGNNSWLKGCAIGGTTPQILMGSTGVVSGNSISGTGLTTLTVGLGSAISDNILFSTGSLSFIDPGTTCAITGNKADYLTLRTGCEATGNYLYKGVLGPLGSSASVLFTGNRVDDNASVSFSWLGTLSLSTITGNKMSGRLSIAAGSDLTIGDNYIGEHLVAPVDSSSITGNRIQGDADIGLGLVRVFDTVTGNKIEGDLEVGKDCTVGSNYVRGLVADSDCTISGNKIGTNNLVVTTGCMISGNWVNGDITVGTGCSVMGNSFANLLPNPDPEIAGGGKTPVVGNRISGSRFGVAGPFVGDYLGNQT